MKKKTTKTKKKVASKRRTSPPRKRTTQRVLSAASLIKARTKKMIDDVFLTIVGTKALVRAQEVTRNLKSSETKKPKGSK